MSSTPRTILDEGRASFDHQDYARAEMIFREGHRQWPDRLDFSIWIARCLRLLGRHDEHRALLMDLVPTLSTDRLPRWGVPALADEGYLLHRGVWLCLDHPVISPWMRQRMRKGDYEMVEADLVAATIEPGERILEVGGGMGFMAAFAARQAPDVHSVVYEANPGLVPVARDTMALNRVGFDFRNAMLGERSGTAEFHVHEAFWASSAAHRSDDSTSIEVAVHDVNAVLAEHEFTMLVMDIEGGEIDLVPAMDLDTVTRVVIETHPSVTGKRSVRALLKGLHRRFGFATTQHVEDVYLLTRER